MMNMALAGLIVLVIGDSQMVGQHYLLTNTHDALTKHGAIVHSYGMCGTVPWDWLTAVPITCGRIERHENGQAVIDMKPALRWSVLDLIDKHHPNLVVIELSDAMAGFGSDEMSRQWVSNETQSLTSRITARNVPCAWVGPVRGAEGAPYYKSALRVREYSQFLAQSVAPCRFIDSTAFARPGEWPTVDGEHLTQDGYRRWGQDIAAALGSQVAAKR